MDINVLRTVSTVLAFVCFVGIVWWAYRRRTQKEFAVAEQLPKAVQDRFVSDSAESAPQKPTTRTAEVVAPTGGSAAATGFAASRCTAALACRIASTSSPVCRTSLTMSGR